jgi:hypothetical protein
MIARDIYPLAWTLLAHVPDRCIRDTVGDPDGQANRATTESPWNSDGYDPSIATRHRCAFWFPRGMGN